MKRSTILPGVMLLSYFVLFGCATTPQPMEMALDSGKVITAYELSEVDQPPRIIRTNDPLYPFDARRKGVQGSVTLRFIVTKEGNVVELSVVKGDPPGIFDDSALKAIVRWKFKPAIKDGKEVDVIIVAPLKFELNRDLKDILNDLYNQGSDYFDADMYVEALDVFNRLAKLAPRDPSVYHNRGLTYKRMGEYKKAVKDFSKAIRLGLKKTKSYTNRADAYMVLTKYRKAIRDYTEAIELFPENPRTYVSRAIAFEKSENIDRACDDLRSACNLGDCRALNQTTEQGVCKD